MVSSRALTVEQYLAELPPERRAVISVIRDVINHHLPPGYLESMNWGMISWEIPLTRYPDTYNGHPLVYMALAAQKNNFALYSMTAYAKPEITARLQEEFRKAGVRLDMGKSCIRFKSLAGLPLPAVEGLASSATVEQYIEYFERHHGKAKPATRPAPRKTARVAASAKAPAKAPRPARKAAKAAPAKKKPVPAKRKPARKVAKKAARAAAKSAARRPAKKAKHK
jgi:hypothetical protein